LTLALVDPLGREPGSDDEAENDDEETGLTTIGATVETAQWDALYAQAMADLLDHSGGASVATRLVPLFKPASELYGADLPSTDWLLRGILTASSVAMTGGEPKSTKTWCGLEMLVAIAAGDKAFGVFPARGKRHVAAFLVEDNPASLRNRLFALLRGRALTKEAALDIASRIHFRCLTALDLRRLEDSAHLVASMRSLPEAPAVVMVDPLRDVIGTADENSASEMSAVMHMARAIRNATKATVLLIHHAGKSSKDSGNRRGGQKLRGSSAIHGALDCGLYLQDTRGNMNTQWKNKAEVEIKGAKGAGVFGLELNVKDDAQGAAQVAGWIHYEDLADMDPQEDDEGARRDGPRKIQKQAA
jgi:hypothetical protein